MDQGELDQSVDAELSAVDLIAEARAQLIKAQKEQVKILQQLKEAYCCGCVILTVGVRWICIILLVYAVYGIYSMSSELDGFYKSNGNYTTSFQQTQTTSTSSSTLEMFLIPHLCFFLFVLFHSLYGIFILVWGNCEIDHMSVNTFKRRGILRFRKLLNIYYFYLLFHNIFGACIQYYTVYDAMLLYLAVCITLAVWSQSIDKYMFYLEKFAIEQRVCTHCDGMILANAAAISSGQVVYEKNEKNEHNASIRDANVDGLPKKIDQRDDKKMVPHLDEMKYESQERAGSGRDRLEDMMQETKQLEMQSGVESYEPSATDTAAEGGAQSHPPLQVVQNSESPIGQTLENCDGCKDESPPAAFAVVVENSPSF